MAKKKLSSYIEEVGSKNLSTSQDGINAVMKAYGVSASTALRAIKRAKGFTAAQRKVMEDAGVKNRDMDVLLKEDEDTRSQVINLIASGYTFDDAIREIFSDNGKDYKKPWKEEDDVESYLAKLGCRRDIKDTESLDADATLFLLVRHELDLLKHRIKWKELRETIKKRRHGLYARRLLMVLDSKSPKYWYACRCQTKGGNPASCVYCRTGSYQID